MHTRASTCVAHPHTRTAYTAWPHAHALHRRWASPGPTPRRSGSSCCVRCNELTVVMFPDLAAPQLGSCTSPGRACWPRAARHSQAEARPLRAQPQPQLLELKLNAAPEVAYLHCMLSTSRRWPSKSTVTLPLHYRYITVTGAGHPSPPAWLQGGAAWSLVDLVRTQRPRSACLQRPCGSPGEMAGRFERCESALAVALDSQEPRRGQCTAPSSRGEVAPLACAGLPSTPLRPTSL